MEYFAVYAPSAEATDAESLVFEEKSNALKTLKTYKDARLKSFKSRGEALKFAKNGTNSSSSLLDSILKSPPPNQPPIKSLEKSNFPAPKTQDLIKFRKEIERGDQDENIKKVYEMICTNPRYLVSSGDTPSILKEGPRYNALHIAAMNKHARMAKLILQTVEQPGFIELLHGIKDDPAVEEMSQFLLESYLNTPDKSRNDTPLHFAAKIGAADVVKVLVGYPLCKMKPNSERKYPKDIICERAPETPLETRRAIEELLNERFFVPLLRSKDICVQPVIGDPFTPANMPKLNSDPRSPTMEIKAYAGPMSSEQAQAFRKRWKTPPRLVPTTTPGKLNTSFSPSHFETGSPQNHCPRTSKSFTEFISSTPKKHKKKLFAGGDYDENDDESFLDNMNNDSNGNLKVVSSQILRDNEQEEFHELFDDLMDTKLQMELEKKANLDADKENLMFKYRNPEPLIDTPVRARSDPNFNHISQESSCKFFGGVNQKLVNSNDSLFCNGRSGSSGAHITYLDESGSICDNVFDSPSFKEKHTRLTDIDKGHEKTGRDLAKESNVEWKEYWDFLGRFVDIRSEEGLGLFENFLKQKETELNKSASPSPSSSHNDSSGLGAVCAGVLGMNLHDDSSKPSRLTKNGLSSPSSFLSRQSLMNDFLSSAQRNSLQNSALKNPYICIEQSCRALAKRLTNALESESIQDQYSYEKMLSQEINKLNTSIDSYKRDPRFRDVNFQKVHARYSFLLVWYLKKNDVEVKYLRNFTPLISKVYALASQYTSLDTKSHAVCLSNFIHNYIEKRDHIYNPENVDTEMACVDAWNGPDISECSCSFDIQPTISKLRREIRKKRYTAQTVDLWTHRASEELEEESFQSCSDSDESDEFFTPPSSPIPQDSDDIFEESMEFIEDEKEEDFALFIGGIEPSKEDRNVFTALGESFTVDDSKYPLVSKWFSKMKTISSIKPFQNLQMKNFRFSTPKLKLKSRFQ